MLPIQVPEPSQGCLQDHQRKLGVNSPHITQSLRDSLGDDFILASIRAPNESIRRPFLKNKVPAKTTSTRSLCLFSTLN